MRAAPVPGRDVPGHEAIGDDPAPLQVAVSAFERVPEDEAYPVQLPAPSKPDARNGDAGRGELDAQRAVVTRARGDANGVATPRRTAAVGSERLE
ncbi:MAG TPA: hypothetical protein VGD56_01340, partial [Gemmatirosa sp.]